MQGSNVGLTVWIFGYAEATIVANDSDGATVHVKETDETLWFPWFVIWKVQDESGVVRESQVGYHPYDGIAAVEYGDAWGDDL